MDDPLAGQLKTDEAELALGIDDVSRDALKQVALLRLIRSRLGITDAEIEMQYRIDLQEQITDTVHSLSSLIRGGIPDA